MQLVLQKVRIFKHTISMINFGAPTLKATWLWSNESLISGIDAFSVRRPKQPPKPLVQVWEDAAGSRKFRGKSDTLKSSQEYPAEFGVAVAKLFDQHHEMLALQAQRWGTVVAERTSHIDEGVLEAVLSQSAGGWDDAELPDVFTHLERRR
jgi:hypothetical protein